MSGILFVLAILAPSGAVLARGEDCAANVESWVSEWSETTEARVEAIRCPTDRELVVLTVVTPAAGSFAIEVLGHPQKAFRVISPVLGASPITTVDDYEEIPAGHRQLFEGLCKWLQENPDKVCFENAAPVEEVEAYTIDDALAPTVFLPEDLDRRSWLGPWLALAALLALGLALLLNRGFMAGPRWQAPILFGAALVSRALLGMWGPLHTNFQGASWVSIAFDPVLSEWYGPGYPEMFNWLTRLFHEAPDYALFGAIGLLSALTPLMTLGVLRLVRADGAATFWAAMLVALEPVSARVATTEGYLPLLVSLNLALLLAGMLGLRARLANRTVASAAAFLAAGLLAAHIVRVHPVGWLPMVLTVPVAAALGNTSLRLWMRSCLHLGAFVVVGAFVSFGDRALENAAVILFGLERQLGETPMVPLWLPWAIGSVAVLGIGLPWIPAMRSRAFQILGLTGVLLLWLVTRGEYGGSDRWQYAYDRMFLVPAAILLFAAVPRHSWTRYAAPCLTVLFMGSGFFAAGMSTFETDLQTRQYQLTREALRETAPECCLAYPGASIHGIPEYIASGPVTRIPRGTPVASPHALGPMLEQCGCLYLLRPALAHRQDNESLWKPFQRLPYLRPILEASLVEEDSNHYSPYLSAEVPIGIYEVLPVP